MRTAASVHSSVHGSMHQLAQARRSNAELLLERAGAAGADELQHKPLTEMEKKKVEKAVKRMGHGKTGKKLKKQKTGAGKPLARGKGTGLTGAALFYPNSAEPGGKRSMQSPPRSVMKEYAVNRPQSPPGANLNRSPSNNNRSLRERGGSSQHRSFSP